MAGRFVRGQRESVLGANDNTTGVATTVEESTVDTKVDDQTLLQ